MLWLRDKNKNQTEASLARSLFRLPRRKRGAEGEAEGDAPRPLDPDADRAPRVDVDGAGDKDNEATLRRTSIDREKKLRLRRRGGGRRGYCAALRVVRAGVARGGGREWSCGRDREAQPRGRAIAGRGVPRRRRRATGHGGTTNGRKAILPPLSPSLSLRCATSK